MIDPMLVLMVNCYRIDHSFVGHSLVENHRIFTVHLRRPLVVILSRVEYSGAVTSS